MLETHESRQFFSVTIGADPSIDTAPAPDTTDVVASKKPKPQPKPTETYMQVTLENALVSSYS